MLNCEYCDYLKSSGKASARTEGSSCYCKFTEYIFGPDELGSGKEYPCRDITYDVYVNRGRLNKVPSLLKGDDWRLLYKNQHPVKERKRATVAV